MMDKLSPGVIVLGLALFDTVWLVSSASLTKRAALSPTVSYYEELDYDHSQLLSEHSRIFRRSLKSQRESVIRWSFHAHSRNFTIQISPDPDIFTKDFSIETDKEVIEFDRNRAFVGHVVGRPGSRVAGILLKDGRFEGRILSDEDDFFVERAETYFPDEYQNRADRSELKLKFHSVIYKLSDVDLSAIQNTTDCKADELKKSMTSIAKSIQIPPEEASYAEELLATSGLRSHPGMYSPAHSRTRRAIDPVKTMCELYIQADHLFYEKFGSNVDTVIEQITDHVAAVNSIFQDTDFDGDGSPDNIRFAVKKLKIWTDSSASGYLFTNNQDVNSFLSAFSKQDNFNSFCLAYTFTHRDFNDGTLGLAWTGSLDASGGVCTRNGLVGGVAMSLNTGIVTTLNFQQNVVFAISQLTFAHELGHNLGSQHDGEDSVSCSPGSDNGGNYIMFPKATDGDKANNKKFSPCSIDSMNEVMNAKARHDGDSACFIAYSATVCGNNIVEPGEDCDCGWDDECTETCCNPQKDTYDIGTYTPCSYTAGAVCSPSSGACCTSSCTVRSASANYECRAATGCLETAECDGTATCPDSVPKDNGTDCSEGKVCYQGECSNAICQAFGYSLCQCAPTEEDDWDDERLCQLCCVDGGTCKPSSQIAAITKETSGIVGQPCFQYQGFCDVFLKCRQLDPVGTLSKLKDTLLSSEGLQSVTDWVKKNWYIVALGLLGFIILLALVVRFGAKHEPIMPEATATVHPSK